MLLCFNWNCHVYYSFHFSFYDSYTTHESLLFSVTLVENSHVEKKGNIIEKEVLIKSRIEVKSISGFLWARLFLHVTFSTFKLLQVFLNSWKVRIFVVFTNSILAKAVLLVTSFPRHFFSFWCLNVAIILCAISASKTRIGFGKEASDFVHLKHWERTLYYISNQKHSEYFFVNNLRIRLPSRI